jgi:glycine dehydrogenase
MHPSLPPQDAFVRRHIGPSPEDIARMCAVLGVADLDALVQQTIPASLRSPRPLDLPEAASEVDALAMLAERAAQNQLWRSYLGQGYHGTITPGVILRNILENPGWYTAYTPYQAEISQGRLEALLIFQTLVQELTGLDFANASMLDEGTAAAEAMAMAHRLQDGDVDRFLVSDRCHPQTIAVVRTRAEPLGIRVEVGDPDRWDLGQPCFGALLQYPDTSGHVRDLTAICAGVHAAGGLVTVATDLLALVALTPPGAFGADMAVGNSQRFGVPMGYGGPHAGFLAARDSHKRQLPGRLIGVSKDANGQQAYRMALQTREQHIRREKATSNICTAQVLLAVTAAMYAVYHGPEGLRRIAGRVHGLTCLLARGLQAAGHTLDHSAFFDTLRVRCADPAGVLARAQSRRINLRRFDDGSIGVSLDETCGEADLADLLAVFGASLPEGVEVTADCGVPTALRRSGPLLTHPVFSRYHSETDMLRFLHQLEVKDLALNTAMIPLGSCTMKLNATAEMAPVTWPGFGALHPFAPAEQAQGYRRLFEELQEWLAEITGFAAVSLQPNAGSQGEYAGLLCIRSHHRARGEGHRTVCLIPTSAHGTNPASAVMAGMRVVAVACDDQGNIDVDDLRAKARAHQDELAALMVTYPSTHGVFEESIREICRIVHDHGGQVYMDGANMNAMVGLCRPGDLGADVCHLNLHKTFCIPHGGGGPGMGPIGVAPQLVPYLPGHPSVGLGGPESLGVVSAAPWGSPSILPISWAYIRMMGPRGLTEASKVAILNANYIARRLEGHYDVLYRGAEGRVAHECILDTRPLKATSGVGADDIAKRLMDYGFHAPTMSWPVTGTLMVEPTESEPLAELDRFCDAMIEIRQEIAAIEAGRADREDNALKHAPHTAAVVCADEWNHAYSRRSAAFPKAGLAVKYWPTVGRVDNTWGDRNLVCACPPWEGSDDR